MKFNTLLLAASLATMTSAAIAQGNADACHNQYGACMERCIGRPASLQESCSSSCEASTNQCYAGMYSAAANAGPANAANPKTANSRQDDKSEARDALGGAGDAAKPGNDAEAKPAPKAKAKTKQSTNKQSTNKPSPAKPAPGRS